MHYPIELKNGWKPEISADNVYAEIEGDTIKLFGNIVAGEIEAGTVICKLQDDLLPAIFKNVWCNAERTTGEPCRVPLLIHTFDKHILIRTNIEGVDTIFLSGIQYKKGLT